MEKPHLKKKIWIISLASTVICIAIMMSIPTIYFQVLPLMITSSILTVILPAYIIEENNCKNSKKQIFKDESLETKIKTAEKKVLKTKKKERKNTDLIADIMNDDNLTLENKKQMLETLKTEYEQNQQTKNNIQKTK